MNVFVQVRALVKVLILKDAKEEPEDLTLYSSDDTLKAIHEFARDDCVCSGFVLRVQKGATKKAWVREKLRSKVLETEGGGGGVPNLVGFLASIFRGPDPEGITVAGLMQEEDEVDQLHGCFHKKILVEVEDVVKRVAMLNAYNNLYALWKLHSTVEEVETPPSPLYDLIHAMDSTWSAEWLAHRLRGEAWPWEESDCGAYFHAFVHNLETCLRTGLRRL